MQIFQAVGLVVEIENVISTLVVVVIGFRLDVDASVEMLVQRVVDSRAVVDLTESIVHKMDVLGDMGRIDIEAIIYSIGVKIQDVETLSAEDWRHYRRVSRWLVAAYVLLGIWATSAGWPILYPIAASATLEGILLLAGTINLKNAHSENTA